MSAIATTVGCSSLHQACYERLTKPWLSQALFLTFVPTPLVLLTDSDGTQSVHIAPEAFEAASSAFGDEIQTWEKALPESITLESVSPSTYLRTASYSSPEYAPCRSSRAQRS